MLKSSLPAALKGTRISIPAWGSAEDNPGLCAYANTLVSREEAETNLFETSPLLLVHSVNASSSAAEVRPLFEHYEARRPTLALELPGFGSSQRGPLPYSTAMMVQSVLRAAHHLRTLGFTQPIDVLGISLSCEFVAMAVLEQPAWFRSVAMVSPTGLESGNVEHFEQGQTKERPAVRRFLTGRLGEPVFRLLTTPTMMRWFLERAWGSPVIDETLLDYEHVTARHPGARFAPAAFIAGALFTRGIAECYANIEVPVWLAHGVRGEFADFGGLLRIGPPANWTQEIFGTGAMPQLEAARLFASRYDAFLERVAVNAAKPVGRSTAGILLANAATRSGPPRDARAWTPARAAAQ
jgi:pimeloyl-ACP methyl ester carboxylesterase